MNTFVLNIYGQFSLARFPNMATPLLDIGAELAKFGVDTKAPRLHPVCEMIHATSADFIDGELKPVRYFPLR